MYAYFNILSLKFTRAILMTIPIYTDVTALSCRERQASNKGRINIKAKVNS